MPTHFKFLFIISSGLQIAYSFQTKRHALLKNAQPLFSQNLNLYFLKNLITMPIALKKGTQFCTKKTLAYEI